MKKSNVAFIPDRTVYLDYNATTPVDPGVIGALDASCRRGWGNPSSLHSCGIQALDQIDKDRVLIADLLDIDPEGIHFCSSGSEALHAGIFGVYQRNRDRVIVSTTVEHPAVSRPLRHLRAAGAQVHFLAVDGEGRLDPELLERTLSRYPQTLLVYSPVNHETGAIQPVREIHQAAAGHDCLIFLDGVQALARLEPREWSPYCDLFAASGHKIHAPKGTALLWKRPDLKIRPFRFGGHQEGSLFPGTENTPGIAALSRAVQLHAAAFREEQHRLQVLDKELQDILERQGVDCVMLSLPRRAAGVLNFSLPWVQDMEELLLELNQQKICISRFSACANRVDGPSRVLSAMGVPLERAATSLRVALGRFSKREDLYYLARVLSELQKKQRDSAGKS